MDGSISFHIGNGTAPDPLALPNHPQNAAIKTTQDTQANRPRKCTPSRNRPRNSVFRVGRHHTACGPPHYSVYLMAAAGDSAFHFRGDPSASRVGTRLGGKRLHRARRSDGAGGLCPRAVRGYAHRWVQLCASLASRRFTSLLAPSPPRFPGFEPESRWQRRCGGPPEYYTGRDQRVTRARACVHATRCIRSPPEQSDIDQGAPRMIEAEAGYMQLGAACG